MENSEFSDAARAGDLARVEELVQQVARLDREAAVRMAAKKGRLEVVQFLTDQCRVGTNTRDVWGCTALMRAAKHGHVDVVRYLAEQRDVDVDVRSNIGSAALTLAAGRGHLDVVRVLAGQHGADVGVKDNDGCTALLLAAENGHLDIVRFLTDQGGNDVNTDDNYGYTALILAAEWGHEDIVRFLTEQHGADANIKDNAGCSALVRAAENGHTDIVRFLAEQYDVDWNEKSRGGYTALLWAAKNGHLDTVRFLADQVDFDVNVKCDTGCTALMLAARWGHTAVVRFLAERHEAEVNSKDNYGRTALTMATENGHIDVVQYLTGPHGAHINTTYKGGCTALILAAEEGNFDVVRFLADNHEVDLNSKTNDGYTALMLAAKNGHMDIVWLLADQYRADVDEKNYHGRTALIEAAAKGHIDVVRFLLEQHEADINSEDNDGHTALILAARQGHTNIVRFLTEDHDADATTKEDARLTVLVWAAKNDHMDLVKTLAWKDSADDNITRSALTWGAIHGSIDVVRYLVENHRTDVNEKDSDGQTALVVAANSGHMDVVRLLVDQYRAEVNIRAKDGITALIRAARYGYMDVVRFLTEQHGADVNIKDNAGYSALMRAAKHGHKDVVWYLLKQCGSDVNALNNTGDNALLEAVRQGKTDMVQWLVEQCSANVNSVDKDGDSTVRVAAKGGYHDIQRILTRFLTLSDDDSRELNSEIMPFPDHPRSCLIPPSEIELIVFSKNRNIGGDFQAKWLDADAVVKLFIPDSSFSSFDDEIQLWQRLRHPNVIKMYGACHAGPQLQFFVCEYASDGSLWEHVMFLPKQNRTIWKYLRDAALGLEYLHERGIVHGDLRCSNILLGSDGMAKLSNFWLSGSKKKASQVSSNVVGSMQWQAPEVLRGNPPSFQSDVYSLGMCIWEAVNEGMNWIRRGDKKEALAAKMKRISELLELDSGSNNKFDVISVPSLLCQDPHERSTLSSVVYELERLVIKESSKVSESKLEPSTSFDDYDCGKLKEAWAKLKVIMENCDNDRHCRAFNELKIMHDRMQETTHYPTLFVRFYALMTEFYQTTTLLPEQANIMRLSSTRATTASMHAFQWRIKSLAALLGDSVDLSSGREACWQQQRSEQIEVFVSGVADTFLLLNDLKSAEERSAFLKMLKAEMDDHVDKYTAQQMTVMEKAYADIASTLESDALSELTPEWFIPWYELIIDEWSCLGTGGFGSVKRAKWLDSDVVVKQVILTKSHNTTDVWTSLSKLSAWEDPSASQVQNDATKRAEALMMFRREVDIWFGFSHPHVVRLFGACHVGRPFFVCEYATNGTLVSYLRKHPDEIWAKLHEATLGVQYLHARDVVHGDLKGNNIVIGRDMKAKVTDFGLSSVASSGKKAQAISGAWQWVAPELLDTNKHPTFASDIYSLGMCIVEALRVVEAVKSGKKYAPCLPWCVDHRRAVKYHAIRGKLPSRPSMCEDSQWELVKKMCALDSLKRIKISTVVDELAKLADVSASSQPNDLSDTLLRDSVNWESVGKVIATVQRQLSQPQDSGNQRDEVLSLHVSLWKNLERGHNHIDGDSSNECRAAFCSLVTDANDATAKLRDMDKNLVSVAQTTMRCYALERSLSKLCDAYFIAIDEPVVNFS